LTKGAQYPGVTRGVGGFMYNTRNSSKLCNTWVCLYFQSTVNGGGGLHYPLPLAGFPSVSTAAGPSGGGYGNYDNPQAGHSITIYIPLIEGRIHQRVYSKLTN